MNNIYTKEIYNLYITNVSCFKIGYMPICIFCLSHPQHCQLRPHGKHKQPCEEQQKGDIRKRSMNK